MKTGTQYHFDLDNLQKRASLMRYVYVGRGSKRRIEVPRTWEESEEMLTQCLRGRNGRGSNSGDVGVASRVAYGMFGEQFMAADPTQALLYLMQRICARKGAGL